MEKHVLDRVLGAFDVLEICSCDECINVCHEKAIDIIMYIAALSNEEALRKLFPDI